MNHLNFKDDTYPHKVIQAFSEAVGIEHCSFWHQPLLDVQMHTQLDLQSEQEAGDCLEVIWVQPSSTIRPFQDIVLVSFGFIWAGITGIILTKVKLTDI